ncbi:MAG: LegC family aminotransferase [Bacteroidales bacterium]|nr:LegC family aminotransferase [Bacteroidales bacterium]
MYNKFIKFVKETYKTDEFIPLHEPRFFGNEKKYLNECIDSTFVSSVGKFVDLFEENITKYTGAKYAIACVNGTAALHIALILSDVKQGDEVITQPLTFIANANAISYTGANPVFIDVDKETLGLSPEKLEFFLKHNTYVAEDGCHNLDSGKIIKACIPMHTFGHPARIDKIKQICNKYKIILIEDAAESLGSYYKGQHTGSFGKFGTLSFNGNKTITTGGGGMLLTNNRELAKKAKHLTTQAKVSHKWEYVHDFVGYNYRLPNINAALGVAQLEQLPDFIKKKRKLADNYKIFFKNTETQFVSEPENSTSNYWLNAILLKNKAERDNFLKFTNENGIMTRPVWELINRLEMFKNYQIENIENAEWLADRVVNIPSSVII